MFSSRNALSSRTNLPAPGASTGLNGAAAGPSNQVSKFAVRKNLKYPFRLNFYLQPPNEEITIEDFEVWALDRLRVLAEVEACAVRGKSFEDTKATVLARCKDHLPLSSNTKQTGDLDAERKKDHYGHFVLRLAFCRSEELRARFLRAETTLFRVRLDTDDADERQRFLRTLDFDWVAVTPEEKERYRKELMAAAGAGMKADDFAREAYVKVLWTKVPDLVSQRRVFLAGGMAYVPVRDQASLVLQEFSARLSKGLEQTARHLPHLDEDSRLLPVLEHLSLGFLAGVGSLEFTPPTDGKTFTADMVDDLARAHFPPCMRNLWQALRRDKHLKHGGRQQFGLFLKGVGLPVEEALVFWRKAFGSITDDKFNKEYKYNIRHNYGLEGSRRDYQPKSCGQIIRDTPGPHDAHGCPFRHFGEAQLGQMLVTSCGITNQGESKDIFDAVKGGHYHIACTRVFEITHANKGVQKGQGLGNSESVEHPNRYFQASYALSNPKEEDVKMEDAPVKPES